MQLAVTLIAAVLGLAFGSFANVPIHRWPRQQTVGEPKRSFCPACQTPIEARDNVPVVSWLLLRGRCRHCAAPISARYPTVELVTAVLFGAVAWVHHGSWALLAALLALTWSLVVATAIDLEWRIIPNRLTYRLPVVLLVLLAVHALTTGSWRDLLRAVVAGIAIPLGMLAFAEAYRRLRGRTGMGLGDIKLLVSIGLGVGALGGVHLVAFAYATVLSAIAVVVVLLVTGRAGIASRIPFGPYLALGTLVVVLFPTRSASVVRSLLGL